MALEQWRCPYCLTTWEGRRAFQEHRCAWEREKQKNDEQLRRLDTVFRRAAERIDT